MHLIVDMIYRMGITMNKSLNIPDVVRKKRCKHLWDEMTAPVKIARLYCYHSCDWQNNYYSSNASFIQIAKISECEDVFFQYFYPAEPDHTGKVHMFKIP